jgi:hypothetical protein
VLNFRDRFGEACPQSAEGGDKTAKVQDVIRWLNEMMPRSL